MNLLKLTADSRSLVRLVHENSDPEYPQYTSFLSRLKTFDSHSPRSCQDKYSLAECGFTYSGTGDLVQCHYCGLLLGLWEENDEVWQQHAMHNPKCVFVLLYKGMEFIENVKNELNNKRSNNDGLRDCRCKSEPYDVGNNRDNSNSRAHLCKSESYDFVG
ncbi:death-associated inhibitor of apoptosis 1-like [Metopolophium dirhodum]|uniref:death-associated inhibitor of apoptosis 1-like n=1 Tax=Metopolophium dirhodum TaxID=44670 RepID=UPI00298F8D6A|nr:death-associated inhibitor of apoptosis 1-like [Metopolophium dirhodum]